MSAADKVMSALAAGEPLDDDELAEATAYDRHYLNLVCRRLEAQGLVERRPGPAGKIVNALCGDSRRAVGGVEAEVHRPLRREVGSPAALARRAPALPMQVGVPPVLEPGRTLVILPCSARKDADAPALDRSVSILDQLSAELARELSAARSRNREAAGATGPLAPAWRRYAGRLYAELAGALPDALKSGIHLLIISGGLGVVLAGEQIPMYNRIFSRGLWPHDLIPRCLADYAARHQIREVRAFAGAATPYAQVIRRVHWEATSVEDAVLISPAGPARGALVPVSRALGQAAHRFLAGGIPSGWRSKDGLVLGVERLR